MMCNITVDIHNILYKAVHCSSVKILCVEGVGMYIHNVEGGVERLAKK